VGVCTTVGDGFTVGDGTINAGVAAAVGEGGAGTGGLQAISKPASIRQTHQHCMIVR